MLCTKCKAELPEDANFCLKCGTAVPKQTGLQVDQEADSVKGDMTGIAASGEAPLAGIDANVKQKIGTVESGGAVVGAAFGGPDGNVHLGGQQSYGDEVKGDKQEVHTEGGAYIGGSVSTQGGDFIGRDKTVYGDDVHGDKISNLFSNVYQQIDHRPEDPNVEKEEITQTVQSIEKEAAKGEQANVNKVERLLKTLAIMAPDILKVTAATLANPAAGIATAIRLIAEKAQAEASSA